MKTVSLILCALLSGCAAVINGIAPTDCYDVRSIAITVSDDAGHVQIAKPAETIRVCPPSVSKVTPAPR